METAESVIERLQLAPLGFEGGFYRETHRSDGTVDVGRGVRSLSTAIYYLHTADSLGLMHRLQSDEIYHHYLGDPVELLLLRDGRARRITLGPDDAQVRIPAGTWQGSRLIQTAAGFALMGTTMSPGFDLADFELGDRDVLLAEYGEAAALIRALTPERLETERLELTAATVDLIHAELRGRDALGAGLRADVPSDWPPPLNDTQTLRFTLERLLEGRHHRSWWQWYVVERDTRLAAGVCGFKGPPVDGTVEIGFSIMPARQRRGIATEATDALIGWAAERGATRITAETLPELVSSRRVLDKLGFRPTGAGRAPPALAYALERPRDG